MDSTNKPTLLFISHVYPGRAASGQQQRVLQMLQGARRHFRIILLTVRDEIHDDNSSKQINGKVDRLISLPSIYSGNILRKVFHTIKSWYFSGRTGLKKSNYIIGEVDLNERRIIEAVTGEKIDCVIFEYWHAWKSLKYFKNRGVPVFLDMHDILSHAFAGQLQRKFWMPDSLKQHFLASYTQIEREVWTKFDGVISINQREMAEVSNVIGKEHVLYCPMGINLDYWNYSYKPEFPPRFGFYGGLGSEVNQKFALFVLHEIMPRVWDRLPNVQLWLIGSNPGKKLQKEASKDKRVIITGFLEDPRPSLSFMTAILCPWEGIFGFRSRLIEVMGLGIPVIASPDAYAGMNLSDNHGILPANTILDFLELCEKLVTDRSFAIKQSHLARQEVEKKFSMESTYEKLFSDLKTRCLN